MKADSLSYDEELIHSGLLFFFAMNYNNFMVTFLVGMPLFLISYFFQLISQAEHAYDQYSGQKLD